MKKKNENKWDKRDRCKRKRMKINGASVKSILKIIHEKSKRYN